MRWFRKRKTTIRVYRPNRIVLKKQIDEYLTFCRSVKGLSKATLVDYQYDLNYFYKFTKIKSLEDISNTEIDRYITWQREERGCKASTINTRISTLLSLVKWQRDMNVSMPKLKIGLICRLSEDPPRQVWYSRDEVNKVLCLADRRAWLMIRLCFECGLRISELKNLRLENIKGREIEFVGKCRIGADLIMSEETRRRLDDWIEREHITDYLWEGQSPTNEKRPLCLSAVRNCMRKPFIKAGFDNFYPHALRHSFATEVVLNGATDEETQHMLRHTNLKNTQRYIHSLGARNRLNFDKYMHCKPDENLR